MFGPRRDSVCDREKLAVIELGRRDDAKGVERCAVNEKVQLHIDAVHAVGKEDRFNFFVHGRKYMFAPMSLNVFSERSPARLQAVWLATHRRFDNAVLCLILLNSVILALTDFRHVDLQDGALLTAPSWRNTLVEGVDPVFTALFTAESALKIFAMGFIAAPGCYLTDAWNWLDLIVVIAGLVGLMPGVPKFSALRTFRVLRPLKSLNAVPGMKKLVTSLLSSIPELLHVVLFLGFMFFVFGIFGVQLWHGALHGRCRTTPFPLKLPAAEGTYPPTAAFAAEAAARTLNGTIAAMYCGAGETWGGAGGAPTPLRDASWSKRSSPWHEARACVWLLDDAAGERLCALPERAGAFTCPAGSYCGSNYDERGNARFLDVGGALMDAPTFVEDLGFGYLNFDNIGRAFLTIFQVRRCCCCCCCCCCNACYYVLFRGACPRKPFPRADPRAALRCARLGHPAVDHHGGMGGHHVPGDGQLWGLGGRHLLGCAHALRRLLPREPHAGRHLGQLRGGQRGGGGAAGGRTQGEGRGGAAQGA